VRTRACEDPILDILKGSARCGHGQAPHGNAPPSPPCAPVSLEQLLATQNDLMCLIVENEMCCVAEHPQPRHQDWDSSYSNVLETHPSLRRCYRSPRVEQLALHDGVHVWATALYGVLENSVHGPTTRRLSWSLVGLLHRHPTN
jgi:hypothetical protein